MRTEHVLNPLRWVNSQDPIEVEMTCVCGSFRTVFCPEAAGKPLREALALFKEHTLALPEEPVL